MMRNRLSRGRTFLWLMCPLLIAAAAMFPLCSLAGSPIWWKTESVLNRHPPNDYAVANIGQAKYFTLAAIRALNHYLAPLGGSGPALRRMAAGLRAAPTAQTNDYAPVTIGQLKTLVAPVYDRLLKLGYYGQPLASGTYPWIGSPFPANDYAVANIGQLKNLFGFDFSYTTFLAPPARRDFASAPEVAYNANPGTITLQPSAPLLPPIPPR